MQSGLPWRRIRASQVNPIPDPICSSPRRADSRADLSLTAVATSRSELESLSARPGYCLTEAGIFARQSEEISHLNWQVLCSERRDIRGREFAPGRQRVERLDAPSLDHPLPACVSRSTTNQGAHQAANTFRPSFVVPRAKIGPCSSARLSTRAIHGSGNPLIGSPRTIVASPETCASTSSYSSASRLTALLTLRGGSSASPAANSAAAAPGAPANGPDSSPASSSNCSSSRCTSSGGKLWATRSYRSQCSSMRLILGTSERNFARPMAARLAAAPRSHSLGSSPSEVNASKATASNSGHLSSGHSPASTE